MGGLFEPGENAGVEEVLGDVEVVRGQPVVDPESQGSGQVARQLIHLVHEDSTGAVQLGEKEKVARRGPFREVEFHPGNRFQVVPFQANQDGSESHVEHRR